MNIKEIAQKAGVSIATVSHVVNKTRYVSSELTERVLSVIEEADGKPGFLLRNLKTRKSDVILCLVENVTDYFYADIVKGIQGRAAQEGSQVVVLSPHNKGLMNEYIRLEKPAGVIIVTDIYRDEEMLKMKELNLPMVIVGHTDRITEAGNVIFDYYESAYKGTHHLIKSGHDRVCFIYEQRDKHVWRQMLAGYQGALADHGIPFDPSLTVRIDPEHRMHREALEKILVQGNRPSALLGADDKATVGLLKFLGNHNLKVPDDISLVSLHEFELSHMLTPAITTVAHDPIEIGRASVDKLNGKINGSDESSENTVVPSRMKVRNSTQSIGRGPLGEKAESPEILDLTPSEIERVKTGAYTAAISFHYSGTAWARLHEKGIKDVFTELGVKVLVVTDAHFDPELQNKQHESILTMNPDVLISIPADEVITAKTYKELVQSGIKLVLINNVPQGFEREDYVTCVTVNERENGQIAGRILGDYLTANRKKKIGLLMHGASFFATKQRDMAVEQVLSEEFPELEIVAVEPFFNESRAFDKCREMIRNHPELEGLYVSWEGPALGVLKALQELGREDISVVTADLDYDVALNLAMDGPIKGISAQRPYDQGRAMALSAANALLGKRIPSFIGVSPYRVDQDNLLTRWQEVLRERAPTSVATALKSINNS
jgi:ribose transport system substrate-binding protein